MRRGGDIVALRDADDSRRFGDKATRLAKLLAAGFPVPSGFVIPQFVLDQHLRSTGLETLAVTCLQPARIGDYPGQQARLEAAEKLRNRLSDMELPTSLQRGLINRLAECGEVCWPVAVRSSAIGEDNGNSSFAGQLDTVLNVRRTTELADAIRTVWASPWSNRCLTYAADRNFQLCGMAVIVQEMVAARWSGVIFTKDPLVGAGAGVMVIEAIEGLGDKLVSGESTPSTFRVSLEGERLVGPSVPDELRLAFSELGSLALKIERLFGAPQDIEWSIDHAGRVWILQARPISAMANTTNQVIWSNANIAENFPYPVSTMLFSIVRRGYAAYFRNLARAFGISSTRIARMSDAFEQIVGVHGDRLYYNVTNIHGLIRVAPFGDWLVRAFNEFTGVTELAQVSPGAPVRRVTEIFEVLKIAIKTIRQYACIERRVQSFERRVDSMAKRTQIVRLQSANAEEVLGHLRGFLDIRLVHWTGAALADVAAMVTYSLLKRATSEITHPSGLEVLHNDLLKGLSNLASARPAAELWQLSRWVVSDGKLAALFKGVSADAIASKLASSDFADFRDALDAYLEQWGFRYSAELMLTHATPQEDPLPVIRLLQRFVEEASNGPEAVCERQAHARVAATDAIAVRLTRNRLWRRCWLSKAGRFRVLLGLTQRAIALRERARMKQALLYTRLRHILLRAGEILCKAGWLAERHDVFLLTVDELMDLLAGGSHSPDATGGIVVARKQSVARRPQAVPPDRLVLPKGAHWQPTLSDQSDDCDNKKILVGTTACAGTVDGAAAVITDVTEAHRLRAGDILVTSQTDPGWAAVFFLLDGLVVERGGMLSHGAIIAREYGIPAVVGVRGATQIIASGNHVRVNADQGRVEVLDG